MSTREQLIAAVEEAIKETRQVKPAVHKMIATTAVDTVLEQLNITFAPIAGTAT
jgi:hypothetical protein